MRILKIEDNIYKLNLLEDGELEISKEYWESGSGRKTAMIVFEKEAIKFLKSYIKKELKSKKRSSNPDNPNLCLNLMLDGETCFQYLVEGNEGDNIKCGFLKNKKEIKQ